MKIKCSVCAEPLYVACCGHKDMDIEMDKRGWTTDKNNNIFCYDCVEYADMDDKKGDK